jgi:hypothetical protein
LQRIECENGDPVDDCRLMQETGSPLVLQCKHSLNLSQSVDSELAKVAVQFVDQHRLPSHASDNLAIATSTAASSRIRNDLRNVLDRIREADADTPIADLPLNNLERNAYLIFASHIDEAWRARTGSDPTDSERRVVLRQCHVLVLDVDPGGAHETEAQLLLRTAVLQDPMQGDTCWTALVERCARLAADRSGADRVQLQEHLIALHFGLKTVLDVDADVARLETFALDSLAALEAGRLTIPSPTGDIDLHRTSIDALIDHAEHANLLIVGDPGIGKTVALHHLARHGIARGWPLLFLAVGGIGATNLGELRNELGLGHDVLEVLAQWQPGTPKLLIVDALDAARSDPQADFWRVFIDVVNKELGDWHVVASVRTWDLRNSPRLRAQFPGPPQQFDKLDDGELHQLEGTWPELADLVLTAAPELGELLRNPFNLRLAAQLLVDGANIAELRAIRHRLELLDRYWEHRVSDGSGSMARQGLIARLCNRAVEQRVLTIPANELIAGDSSAGPVLEALLSRSVLSETAAIAGLPGGGAVSFSHHVLFDYAVAVTLFGSAADAMTKRLHDDPDLVLSARPSIDMHLERLWTAGPEAFWPVALAIAADDELPRLATVAVSEVVARRATAIDELEPLLQPVLAGDGSPAHERVLRYVAVAIVIDREEQDDWQPGVWPEVIERLSTNIPVAELPLRTLLDDFVRRELP